MPIDKQIEMQNKKNSPDEGGQDSHDRILYLLEENRKTNKEVYAIVKKLKKQMMWQSIFGFVRILVIVIPLIIGFYYLTPFVQQAMDDYQKLMGVTDQVGSFDINALPKDMMNLLK